MTSSTLIIPNIEFVARDGPHLCSRPIVGAIAVAGKLYNSERGEFGLPRSGVR